MGEFKETNIDWLGSIPSDWKLTPLKYICSLTTGNKDTINRDDDGIYPFFVRSKNVERINSYSYDGEAILTAGDGDICKIWHYINGKFDFHQRVYMLFDFKIHAKFLLYYISENFYHDVFKLSAKSTVDSLRRPMFENFPVAVPPKQTQIRIAEFLDKKTAEIDTIIEKKEALLLRLEEKKKAIINEAVTKGLNPNAPMKDSGIEWIGEIPAHWEVKPLGYLGTCQNGVSKGGDYFGTGFPFVNYGDIYKNFELPYEVEGLAQSSVEDRIAYSVQYGDVFFTRTSETIEEIGIASTCLKTIENAVFSGFTIRFRPHSDKDLLPLFSKYLFRSNYIRTSLVKEMNLVTRASLSQNLLKSIKIIIPPINEQKYIAEFLERKFNESTTITNSILTQIEKLKEYRQAIISEAVTGKLEIA